MATAAARGDGVGPIGQAAPDHGDEPFLRVQELRDRLESVGDPTTVALADELVSSVVQMYGEGLARIVELVQSGAQDASRIGAALAEDPLVAALLMIHDLHPVPLEARVREALDRVRPYMESHGGDVQLLSVSDGVARIRLRGSCRDCSASAVTLELAIKQALEDTAPDLESLEVEGFSVVGGVALPMAPAGPPSATSTGAGIAITLPLAGGGAAPEPGGPSATDGPGATGGAGMTLPMASSAPAAPSAHDLGFGRAAASPRAAGPGPDQTPAAPPPPPPPAWLHLDEAGSLAAGAMLAAQLAGEQLVVANVDGTLLAYRDVCTGCGSALHDGELRGGALSCASCGRTFSLPRAGRCAGDEALQLAPVPLLREDGSVKVALAL